MAVDTLPAPVTKTVDDYAGDVTPWQAKPIKARFLATVRADVQPYVDAQALIASLPAAFDLDFAVGVQLDAVGLRIGRTRYIPTPVPNVLFSFDTDNLGWDQGYWQGPYDSAAGLSALADEDYRRLLYAKVIANAWDGTSTGMLAVLLAYFTDSATNVFIQDGGRAVQYGPDDMLFMFDVDGKGWDQGIWLPDNAPAAVPDMMGLSYSVCIAGKLPSVLDLYLLASDRIPVKAMGVDVDYSVTTVDGAPLFGFDMDDARVSGFDVGAWGADPITVAGLIGA